MHANESLTVMQWLLLTRVLSSRRPGTLFFPRAPCLFLPPLPLPHPFPSAPHYFAYTTIKRRKRIKFSEVAEYESRCKLMPLPPVPVSFTSRYAPHRSVHESTFFFPYVPLFYTSIYVGNILSRVVTYTNVMRKMYRVISDTSIIFCALDIFILFIQSHYICKNSTHLIEYQ